MSGQRAMNCLDADRPIQLYRSYFSQCLGLLVIFLFRNLKRFRNGGARNDYRSSVQSKSVSRSPTPRDRKNYRSRRSPSPRENGRGPHEGKEMEPSRSNSPRGNTRSPSGSRSRSYSPRG